MVINGGSGLAALEFADCLLDSPEFRENLNRHEKELDKTSQQIKRIIKEIKDLLQAAKNLSRCQRTLAKSLNEFNFECIGSTQTDDEQVIADSLKQFGKLISAIEDERDNMLDRAHDQIVVPLEGFRKDAIGGVKDKKKQHDKRTAKFCQAQEKILNLSSKKPDSVFIEADAALGMLKRDYMHESLNYVLKIQDVQERIKFEFVEILLGFMSGWLVFYHLGHEVAEDAKDYMTDLQHKVQKTREGFTEFQEIAQELKNKYMNFQLKPESEFTQQGYLYLMEKKAFTATWQKYYCTYKKQNKQFTMLQYNQQIPGRIQSPPEKLSLASCTRCISDFEKRFCFDLAFEQKPNIVYTFQALSEKDRKVWLDAMDGKDPIYLTPGKSNATQEEEYFINDIGFAFVKKCIECLEQRGLEEEGLYRVSGVGTKINKLLQMGLDVKKTESERLAFFADDQFLDVLESKTIASALKQYLRKLKEPIMTYRCFHGFLAAAKQEQHLQRISDVHALIHRLPKHHLEMLDIIIHHLKNVAAKSNKNKMSIFNLGVVFGPTLLKANEDSLAAVLEIKFNNLVIEILIENYELIFKSPPGKTSEYVSRQPTMSPPFQRLSNHHYRDSSSTSAGEPRNSQYPQPIRVVAKSNYTDPVMSSSLQNIPNGMSIYHSTSPSGSNIGQQHSSRNNRFQQNTQHQQSAPSYQLYETKSSTNINQKSLSPIMRDASSLSSRELSSGGYMKSASPPATLNNNNSYQNAIYVQKQQFYSSANKFSRENTPSGTAGLNKSGLSMDSPYGTVALHSSSSGQSHKQPHHNALTSSETNLPKLFDRIHSSDESVCSSSSRDLNLSSQHHHLLTYGSSGSRELNKSTSGSTKQLNNIWNDYQPLVKQQPIYNDVMSSHSNNNNGSGFIPKKQQRHKDKDEIVKAKPYNIQQNWRVRTLYACLAENEGELSFEPNQIIINVSRSNEPGWLVGTLQNGKSGLIPENYVEILN